MLNQEANYIELIRSNYAAMADNDLLALWNERHGLTPEALEALKAALGSRLLPAGTDRLNLYETETVAEIDPDKRFAAAEMKLFWQLILNLKLENQPDETIANRLAQKGLTIEEAGFMLNNFTPVIIGKINQADSDRLGALIRLCCGIAVIIITMLASLSNGMYAIGWIVIALSMVQTAIASSKKNRYQIVLNQLQQPDEMESELPET